MNLNILAAAKSGMNFANLTSEGLAAFVIAIIFSIVSVAGFIYFAKHQHLGRVLTILITMAFPFVSVFCWAYLLFNIFACPALESLGFSLLCAVVYLIAAIIISTILNNVSKANEKEKTYQETHAVKAHPQTKQETVEQTLLIAHTAEEKTSATEAEEETTQVAQEPAVEDVAMEEVVAAIATAVALNEEEIKTTETVDSKKGCDLDLCEPEIEVTENESVEEVEEEAETSEPVEEIDEEELFNKELETVLAIIKDVNFGEATQEVASEEIKSESTEEAVEEETTTQELAAEEIEKEVEAVEEVVEVEEKIEEAAEEIQPTEEVLEDEDWKKYDPTALLFDDDDIELLAPFEDEE